MATTFLQVKNRATSTLASGITDIATSLVVAAGGGANFPSTYPFHITIENEILSCTNRVTDTLTVVRAQQGTTGVAHSAGAVVSLNITAMSVSDLNTAVNAIENAKGAASGLASLNASSLVVQNPATSYIPAAEKAAASGVASLDAASLVVQNPATSYIPLAQKAAASGVASLDATSKVVQVPASVLGAPGLLADDQHVLDAEVTAVAIALTQKAAASGVASLSAASLVVQKPADRLGVANLEFTLNKLLKGAGVGANPTEIDVPGGADFPYKMKPALARWVVPGWYSYAYTLTTVTAGVIYYVPIFVGETTTYIRIAIVVDTLSAGTADLRIFAWSNGLPGALILSAGTVDTGTTGAKEIIISQQLTRGYYFLAVRFSATPTIQGFDTASAISSPVSGFFVWAGVPCSVVLGVTAAFADPAPAPTDGYSAIYNFIRLREN